jgi:hypothetical protein
MLIVGGVAAFSAISAFFLWRLIVIGRARLRQRRMRNAPREMSVEKIAAE